MGAKEGSSRCHNGQAQGALHPSHLPGLSQVQSGASATSFSPTGLPGCHNSPVVEHLPCTWQGTHMYSLNHSVHYGPHLTDEESMAQMGRDSLELMARLEPCPCPTHRLRFQAATLHPALGLGSSLPFAQSPRSATDILPAACTPRIPCCQPPASASEQAAFQPTHGPVSLCPSCAIYQVAYRASGILDTLVLEVVKWRGCASLLSNLIVYPSQAVFLEREAPEGLRNNH